MSSVSVDQSNDLRSLFRPSALLLTFQIILWVAVIAMVVRFTPNVPPGPNDAWSAQRAETLSLPWVAFHVTMVTAFACGTLGIMLIAQKLMVRGSRLTGLIGLVFSLISLVLAFTYLGLRLSILRIDLPMLSAIPAFQASNIVAVILTEITLIANIAVSLGLRQIQFVQRSAVAAIVLSVLMMIAGLYAPPFVFGIIWFVLGIPMMRGQSTKSSGSQAVIDVK